MDVPRVKATAADSPVSLTERTPRKLNPNHSLCGCQRARNPLSNQQHRLNQLPSSPPPVSHYLRSRQHQLLPNKILADEVAAAPSLKGRNTNRVNQTLSTLKRRKFILIHTSNPSGVAAVNVEGEEALTCVLISLGSRRHLI